jgi:hypothetical protein
LDLLLSQRLHIMANDQQWDDFFAELKEGEDGMAVETQGEATIMEPPPKFLKTNGKSL